MEVVQNSVALAVTFTSPLVALSQRTRHVADLAAACVLFLSGLSTCCTPLTTRLGNSYHPRGTPGKPPCRVRRQSDQAETSSFIPSCILFFNSKFSCSRVYSRFLTMILREVEKRARPGWRSCARGHKSDMAQYLAGSSSMCVGSVLVYRHLVCIVNFESP